MTNPLFSTYRGGENRVTSSTIAVFERIDLAMVRELLQVAAGLGDELRGVQFENQVASTDSVPDARIAAHFTWWVETKTARNGYESEGHDRKQVRARAKRLEVDPEATLFVLTPDATQPGWFETLDGVQESVRERIVWFSFASLATAIRQLTGDPPRLISEQTRFLLAELVALYEADGLLTNDDTVVVAAKTAWLEYQRLAAYVCQPDRAFRPGLTHFGFYAQGRIMPVIARIHRHVPAVEFSAQTVGQLRAEGDQRLADLIETLLDRGGRVEGQRYGVILLSGRNDVETVQLTAPIMNDTTASSGRGWAWTMGQRYTQLAKLTSGATKTSEL